MLLVFVDGLVSALKLSGKPKGRMERLELRIPPLALMLVFAALMASLAYALPATIDNPYRLALMVTFFFVGAAFASAGVAAFWKHKTTVNPFTPDQSCSLVDSGVYRYTRNPMYLGFFLILTGWGFICRIWFLRFFACVRCMYESLSNSA